MFGEKTFFDRMGLNLTSAIALGTSIGLTGCELNTSIIPEKPNSASPISQDDFPDELNTSQKILREQQIVETPLPEITKLEGAEGNLIHQTEPTKYKPECIGGCVYVFTANEFALKFDEFQEQISGKQKVTAISLCVPEYRSTSVRIPQRQGHSTTIDIPIAKSNVYIVLTEPLSTLNTETPINEVENENREKRAGKIQKLANNMYLFTDKEFELTLAEFSQSIRGSEQVISFVPAPHYIKSHELFAKRSGASDAIKIPISNGYLVFTKSSYPEE